MTREPRPPRSPAQVQVLSGRLSSRPSSDWLSAGRERNSRGTIQRLPQFPCRAAIFDGPIEPEAAFSGAPSSSGAPWWRERRSWSFSAAAGGRSWPGAGGPRGAAEATGSGSGRGRRKRVRQSPCPGGGAAGGFLSGTRGASLSLRGAPRPPPCRGSNLATDRPWTPLEKGRRTSWGSSSRTWYGCCYYCHCYYHYRAPGLFFLYLEPSVLCRE